ncbi:MAG: hypothetical protein MJ211_10070 [Bacteroidales bacterium]|nr:hypothetical protein [Bacteroidales bacterium]
MEAQTIIKGDDTFFNDTDYLGAIELITNYNMIGWRAEMKLQDATISFNDLASKRIQPRFTKGQTAEMRNGKFKATLKIYDPNNNLRTVFTDLPYYITSSVAGEYVNE